MTRPAPVEGLSRRASQSSRVLGIGEVLWDLFPDGPRLGGAPFNVVANLGRLGHPAKFATVVGDDDFGREAIRAAGRHGVDTDLVYMSRRSPTGTAVVHVNEGTPSFDLVTPAAYEELALEHEDVDALVRWAPRAVIFGTLAQRFPPVLETTRRIVAATPDAERLYDVNLRPGCWTADIIRELLPLSTVVKVNDDEATIVGATLGCEASVVDLGGHLAKTYGVRCTCVTHGADGASLWLDEELFSVPAVPVTVVDSVGAGDAFAAGLLHGLLEGLGGAKALDFANRLGAIVASRPGALPDWTVDDIRGGRTGAAVDE